MTLSPLAEAVLGKAPYFTEAPSFKGRLWRVQGEACALSERMVGAYGLPDVVARLLASRGVTFEGVEGFLNPRMKDHFPNPCLLRNMEGASDALSAAIISNKKIGILADFDVDGATSAAILMRFLRSVGLSDIPLYIPDRLNEGYGPNNTAFQYFKDNGCDWVLIADCGTTAFAPLSFARELGLKTIILDHHEAEATLPECDFLVNPKQAGDSSGLDMLAACGVCFLFCVAVNTALKRAGREGVDLRQWLDLVALGTVCDMVPMLGANRLFVKAGFTRMAARENVGINALLEVGKIDVVPDPSHAGFVLGPRINAGSRVHQSDLGAQLLSTDDPAEAKRLAWLLDDCNTRRRAMQKDIMAHASARVQAFGYDKDPVIVLDDAEWHPGLVGLVAGDIKEKFGKPTCIIGYAEGGDGRKEGRGSGRSVNGINIADAFMAARAEGLLIKGGGHAMAGGFTIEPDKIKDFREFMKAYVGTQAKVLPPYPESVVDGVLAVRSVTIDLAKVLHGPMAPYGAGHEAPNFVLKNVMVLHADIVGNSHVRCTIRDRDGGNSIKAVAFRAAGTELGKFLLEGARDSAVPVHLLGAIQINSWQGRESAEFHISDGCVGYI